MNHNTLTLICFASIVIAILIMILIIAKKHGIKSIFNTRAFILGPLSCIAFLINYIFSNREQVLIEFNKAAQETGFGFGQLAELLQESDNSDAQIVAIIALCVAILIWIFMLIINICKYQYSGIALTIIQAALSPVITAMIMYAFILFAFLAIAYIVICISIENIKEKYKARSLVDRYGISVDHVRDINGNVYYVDGDRIKDSDGRYVSLRKNENEDYVDEYGRIYYN